jgi:hypothetical protein
MQKIILAYNFTPERLQALKLICMMLRTQLRAVAREELLQPVGYLAGLSEVAPVSEAYSGDEGQMLLMCGFSRQDLDRLLAAIKKGKLRQVALKAMLTPTNCTWSGLQLLQELSQEHAYMHGKNAGK